MLNCWKNLDVYHNVVKDHSMNMDIKGRGRYVLKEKLKMYKLNEWFKSLTQNFEGNIQKEKEELNALEI